MRSGERVIGGLCTIALFYILAPQMLFNYIRSIYFTAVSFIISTRLNINLYSFCNCTEGRMQSPKTF